MKKEMLRIHNLSVSCNSSVHLRDISFCLMEGECVGFLGLVNSGKDELLEFFNGGKILPCGDIWIDNCKRLKLDKLYESVYRIISSNYIIEDWTVAEYLELVRDKSFLGIFKKKELVENTNKILTELSLDIDPNTKLKDLTELEKRLVDLAKAYSSSCHIIIIDDEFAGCTVTDIRVFRNVLKKVINQKMVAIINSHSDLVSDILAEKYIIFKKGLIVKKCNKSFIQNKQHLEKFLLGTTITSKKKNLDSYMNVFKSQKESRYEIKYLTLQDGRVLNMEFGKGEIITILGLDINSKKYVFDVLSGRCIDKQIEVKLEDKVCDFEHVEDFVNHRIVSIEHMGNEDELLPRMTVGENLIIPSLDKISSVQYVFSERKMVKMLENQVKETMVECGQDIYNLGANDQIMVILERWYIYRPKVLILLEPFIHCDIFGVSIVQSYIKKFASMGTAVIIVKSRIEYMEDISDRMIGLD